MAHALAELADRPFDLLCALEDQLTSDEAGTDEASAPGPQWQGLAFTIGDAIFLVPRAEVREIVKMPVLTPVPGAKPWLCGVANLRGDLVPITDLGLFLGFDSPRRLDQSWVIVLEDSELPAGFCVDEVGEFRHFAPDEQHHALLEEAPDNAVKPFLVGAFVQQDWTWHVLSLRKLARDRSFRDAAL